MRSVLVGPVVAGAAITGALLGCSDAPLFQPVTTTGPSIVTNANHSSWSVPDLVKVTITNPDGSDVFVYGGSPPLTVDAYRDGHWERLGPGYGCACDGPLTYSPIGRADTLREALPLLSSIFPRSGWYRARIPLLRSPHTDDEWADEHQVSAPFWVGP